MPLWEMLTINLQYNLFSHLILGCVGKDHAPVIVLKINPPKVKSQFQKHPALLQRTWLEKVPHPLLKISIGLLSGITHTFETLSPTADSCLAAVLSSCHITTMPSFS